MNGLFTLRVGPAMICLSAGSDEIAQFLHQRYSAHIVRTASDALLEIRFNPALDFKNPTAFKIEADDSTLSARSSAASLEWDFQKRRGMLETAPVYLYFPIENSLRILFSRLELEYEATLVHAAAAVGKGRRKAALFPGRSGAGKSTLSKAAEDSGATALGDDIVAIFKNENGWFAAGTPFAGVESPRPPYLSAPLGMIAFLGGRGKTELKPIGSAEAAAALAASIPFSDALSGTSGKTALRLAADAAKTIPVFRASYELGGDPSPLWEHAE